MGGDPDVYAQIERMALRMRERILNISHHCDGPTHLGGGLSIVEIMALLYGRTLRIQKGNPTWSERDRFILSKGHGVLGLYAALAEAKFITEEEFSRFKTDGNPLIAHPVMNLALGIESSNGSLGQGLSMAVGIAWAAMKKAQSWRTYVLLGDGECNEGSVWEAAMAASQFKLRNLVAIIDQNGFQSDGPTDTIMSLTNLSTKWGSFGWEVIEVDGHDVRQLEKALLSAQHHDRPTCVIASTVKGKGVDFMEANNDWHHNRLTQVAYDRAIESLGSAGC